MPEGDTIFRVARTLHLALAGKVVTRFTSVYPALTRIDEDDPVAGRTVLRVDARGKHLLIHFGSRALKGRATSLKGRASGLQGSRSPAFILRTHMRMKGSWHIYRPGEAWQRPRGEARIVIETADFVAVAFNVPIAEFLDETQAARQEDLRSIGPDLLGATFDEDEAVRRLRQRGPQAISEALLNQRVVAGIGNVYKSETLFLEHVRPATPVSGIDEQKLREVLRTARKLLKANVAPSTSPGASSEIITYRGLRRMTGRTDPEERLWVYGRGGRPCRKCGTPISYAKTGPDARGTYWCARCQLPPRPARFIDDPG